MIKEHDYIVLTTDLPEDGLVVGDIGTVVHVHDGGAGCEVEFMTRHAAGRPSAFRESTRAGTHTGTASGVSWFDICPQCLKD